MYRYNPKEKKYEKILIGRKVETKQLERFFFGNKSCSLTGPNGIGKTYLKDILKNKFETERKEHNVYFVNYDVKLRTTKEQVELSIREFWEAIVLELPDEEELTEWLQEKEKFAKSIEKIVNKDEDVYHCDKIDRYVKSLLKAYYTVGIHLLLCLDEFDRVQGYDSEFFRVISDMERNSKNLTILFVSRKRLNQIAPKNPELFKEVEQISLKGFSNKDLIELSGYFWEWGEAILCDKMYEYCGTHPASWESMCKAIDDKLMGEQRAITIKEVEEAFSTDICKGKINDVAEQLYKLMREEYIDQKQKRTYLEAFADIYIEENETVSIEELEKLYEAGFVVRLQEEFSVLEAITGIDIRSVKKNGKIYEPISPYAVNYIKAKLKQLQEQYEEVKKEIAITEETYPVVEKGAIKPEIVPSILQGENGIASHGTTIIHIHQGGMITTGPVTQITNEEGGQTIIGEKPMVQVNHYKIETAREVQKEVFYEYENETAEEKVAKETREYRQKVLEKRELLRLAQLQLEQAQDERELELAKEAVLAAEEEYIEAENTLEEAREEIETKIEENISEKLRAKFKKVIEENYDLDVLKQLFGVSTTDSIESTITVLEHSGFEEKFKFATFLHSLFDILSGEEQQDNSRVDYSAVSILYAKLYEGFLKQQHYEMYQVCLANVETDIKKPKKLGGGMYTYGTMPENKATIGKFLYPIYTTSKKNGKKNGNQVTGRDLEVQNNLKALKNKTNNASEWNKHIKLLSIIKDIRNDEAHMDVPEQNANAQTQQVNTNDTKDSLKELTQAMINQGGLVLVKKLREYYDN